MTPLEELLGATLDHLEQLFSRSESVTGLATGYTDLDEQLAGLQPSILGVVGARPAMGKTAFALGMVANAGVKRIVFGEFYRDPRGFDVAARLGIELIDLSAGAGQ